MKLGAEPEAGKGGMALRSKQQGTCPKLNQISAGRTLQNAD